MNNKFENNLVLIGSYIDSLDAILLNEENQPKLAILDLSYDFLKLNRKINPKDSHKHSEIVQERFCFLDPNNMSNYFSSTKNLITKIYSILHCEGFLAIKVNGTTKYEIKAIADEVFRLNNFINEILINSPFIIISPHPNHVIEQTNYILLYSKSNNPKISPVYNKKVSGGYWHSFVSKGQGSAKNFLFNDQLVKLQPPVGTHWKLKQETIIKLCKKGKIRMNRNGNPEYWVPERKGQIVDSNWLDLNLHHEGSDYQFSYSEVFMRLFSLILTPKSLIIQINSDDIVILIKAVDLDLQWICLLTESNNIEKIKLILEKNGIQHKIKSIHKKTKESVRSPLEKVKGLHKEVQISKKESNFSLNLISRYSGKEKVDQWSNTLIQGDCVHILRLLRKDFHKSIKLIYIDPPFYTGNNEVMNIPFGSIKRTDSDRITKISHSAEFVAYNNALKGETPIEDFKSWFRQRLSLMKPLLRLDGFIIVRFDYHFGHYAKLVLDEVMKPENFVIEFLVRRMKKNLSVKQLNQQTHLIVHNDSLFVYRASHEAILNTECIEKKERKAQDYAEREFTNDNVWLDIAGYQKVKKTLYPTENSETLLKRVINSSTSPEDIVADFFAGSGTTLAIAETLERKWIGVDIGSQSIHEIRKRLLQLPNRRTIDFYELNEQILELSNEKHQTKQYSPQVSVKTNINGNKVTLSLQDYTNPSKVSMLKDISSYLDIIDYWEIDWDYSGSIANINWYSKRLIEKKVVITSVDTSVTKNYDSQGTYRIYVKVIDIFGNSVQRILKIQI